MVELAAVHEMHNSERKSFRACRRRWEWIFLDRWYPPLTAKPLEFGVAYHEAMEVYYDPKTWEWDRQVVAASALGAFLNKCEAQKQKYLSYLRSIGEPDSLADDVKADYEERVELGKGMLTYYFENVAPKLDADYKPVKVEIPFLVPIIAEQAPTDKPLFERDQAWVDKWVLRCNSPRCKDRHVPNAPIMYAGRIDAIMEDHNGDYWLFDWKTAARLATEAREEFLLTDDQITSYCWAMRQCGVPIRGFIYHEQRKAFPQPPAENKVQRLGCWYSKNKQQATSYDMYLETVKEHDLHAYEQGLYDDMLEFLQNSGPDFYARFQIHRSPKELDNAGDYLRDEALDMCSPTLRIYPMGGRFSCSSCAFRQPCIGQTSGEDYMYTLNTLFERREHYWIREEPSTDTKGGE